jgi:hypothetical protein
MLAMLHLLAVADGRATGPTAWSPWIAALVQRLVTKVRAVFDETDPDEVGDGAVVTARAAQALAPELGADPGAGPRPPRAAPAPLRRGGLAAGRRPPRADGRSRPARPRSAPGSRRARTTPTVTGSTSSTWWRSTTRLVREGRRRRRAARWLDRGRGRLHPGGRAGVRHLQGGAARGGRWLVVGTGRG